MVFINSEPQPLTPNPNGKSKAGCDIGCQQMTKARFRNCHPGSCGLCAAEGWWLACRREIFRGRKTRGLSPGWEKIGPSALRSAQRSQPGGNTRGRRHQGSLPTSGGFREVKRGGFPGPRQERPRVRTESTRKIATTFGPFLSGGTGEGPFVLKYQCLPASTADPTVWLPVLIAASFNGLLHPNEQPLPCRLQFSSGKRPPTSAH